MKEPLFALMLAEAAYAIAERLPDDYYPADAVYGLRGTAWKDYSTACRYLGQIENGFDALRRAERAYRKLPDPGVDLAVVNLCRALLFFEREQYPDALQLIRSAASRFDQRLERSRYFQAREVEAIILHQMGDVESARTTYEEAAVFADRLGDPDMKARAARNLGIAYREAGDIDGASRYFLTALQLYEALGSQAMVVHTRWSIVMLSLAAGNPEDAADSLPPIIRDLTALGIIGDAARAHLDLAEALLILRRFDAVEAACAGLFEFFTRAEMLTGALRAASYLKECAAARRLTRGDIETVRKYFSDLERAPDLVFAPPPG
ncbi:MAG TPA: tetratricopeptide repeat protein [Thermoanaerobaculia bacterium]|nr:tetratricopeptide repeat protein [Thermoanaerobaculia bacterium]